MNARVCTTIPWLMAMGVLMCWAGTTVAAQVRQYDRTLGTIPSVGDTVWMYAHDRANSDDDNPDRYPAMAFAEGANLIFRLGYYDHVIAVDGRTGLEHGRVNITKLMQTSRSVTPEAVSCTRDGRLVLVKYRVRDTLHTILVSYPEGQLVRNFPFTPSREPRFDYGWTSLSPDGRWVVAPASNELSELHDLQTGTRESMGGFGDFHFNTTSTELLVALTGHGPGVSFTVIDLMKQGHPRRTVNGGSRLWNAKFSDNGRYALAYTGPGTLMRLPQLTVFDLMTGDTVWQITGTRIEDENINSDKDMLSYAISADGSLVYAYRDDTVAGTYLKGGYFYRMPDTIPIARSVVPVLSTFQNWAEVFDSPLCDGGLSLWSPDLRRRFVSPRQGRGSPFTVMALDYDFTTSTGPDATTAGSTDAGGAPVYPNPTTGTVTLPTSSDGPMAWSLWSTTASRIDGGQGMAAGGRLVITLPQSLPAGRYMLSVHPENRPSAIRSYTIVMN